MRTRNKIIKEVIQCAEANGWHVDAEKHQDKNIVIFEFSQFTPAGQDFFFSATMQGRSLESLVSDMEEYYEGFDADSEAYLWLDGNGHGKNGAPYRMKDVLADMERRRVWSVSCLKRSGGWQIDHEYKHGLLYLYWCGRL